MSNIFIFLYLFVTTIINIVIPLPGNSIITPFLAFFTDPKQAIALVGFYFMISGIIRMIAFRQHISWSLVKGLLPSSIFGAILGSLSLISISEAVALAVILISSIFFLYKKTTDKKSKTEDKENKLSEFLVGTFSGFLQSVGLSGSDLRNNFLYSKSQRVQVFDLGGERRAPRQCKKPARRTLPRYRRRHHDSHHCGRGG